MRFLLPKEPAFAEHFKKLNGYLKDIAEVFSEFSKNFDEVHTYAEKASAVESKADEVTHGIISELNKTFITPFDREDIHSLAHEMDDIVDLIENAIHNIDLYQVKSKNPAIDTFARLIVEASQNLDHLIQECFSEKKYTEKATSFIIKIHDLEDEGDSAFQQALKKLFSEEKDPLTVIKWKDLLENLEEIMDKFQSLSNTIESIIVKSS